MLKKILLGLLVAVAVFLVYVASRPADYRVERSATLPASPTIVFAHVNDHRHFNAWNPFMKLDPAVTITYDGPTSGVGASCNWDGNQNIGAGSATIIESRPGELVRMRMDWKRPMEGTGTVDFTFHPVADGTRVTWAMYGRNNFLGKAVSVFMDCDEMCGPPFEQGLADLSKRVATPTVAAHAASSSDHSRR